MIPHQFHPTLSYEDFVRGWVEHPVGVANEAWQTASGIPVRHLCVVMFTPPSYVTAVPGSRVRRSSPMNCRIWLPNSYITRWSNGCVRTAVAGMWTGTCGGL